MHADNPSVETLMDHAYNTDISSSRITGKLGNGKRGSKALHKSDLSVEWSPDWAIDIHQ